MSLINSDMRNSGVDYDYVEPSSIEVSLSILSDTSNNLNITSDDHIDNDISIIQSPVQWKYTESSEKVAEHLSRMWKNLSVSTGNDLAGCNSCNDSKENGIVGRNEGWKRTRGGRPLRICVLQSQPDGTVYADDDSPADLQIHFERAGYTSTHVQIENIFLTKLNYASTLIPLMQRMNGTRRLENGIDCFINLCDGAWDEPSVGIEVVDLLERKLHLPFTGANVSFFEPTRLDMKKAAISCNVSVPLWRFVYNHEELHKLLLEFDHTSDASDSACVSRSGKKQMVPLRFPLLVKHFSSYSSIGLVKESKVMNVVELQHQCSRMIDTFGGCLIEEFIIGREFTILVSQFVNTLGEIDIMAYEPIECRFGPGEDFKHYDLKWVDYDNISWQRTPSSEGDLNFRLKQLSIDVFNALGGRGYGRIDVRANNSGTDLYFLEINPNCGVFYPPGLYGSADFILDQHDSALGHAQFALQQIDVAYKQWKQEMDSSNIVCTQYNSISQSWGLFAQRDIKIDEIIQLNEEVPTCIVSKKHVLQHWHDVPSEMKKDSMQPIDKGLSPLTPEDDTSENGSSKTKRRGADIHNTYENFCSYCWPLSDNLFAMWHREPDKWRPINHSCEPNSWFENGNSLNVVSRFPITAGEEITMDYATFCGFFPEMKQFSCTCGSQNCRGIITGMDIIKHRDLHITYANHMTDYVSTRAESHFG
jgi:D-ala D-ala ligase C-terminus/SET domain